MVKGRNLKTCRSAQADLFWCEKHKNIKNKQNKQKHNKDKAGLHWEDDQVALEFEPARRKVII